MVIFGDSFTHTILLRDFNGELDTGHVKVRAFPGAISKEFLHYVTLTLEDGNFDIAI